MPKLTTDDRSNLSTPSNPLGTNGRFWWVLVFLAHEVLLLSATYFPFMQQPAEQHRPGFFWFQWDSLRYITTGIMGYSHLLGIAKYQNAAFFPFVPVLVRIIGPWTVLILEQVVFILILVLLKGFSVRMGLQHPRAIMAVWLFALCPASIFYSAVYAEPWTLFCGLASLYFATRKQWILAAILGIFTSLTQGTGALFGMFPLVLFIYAIVQKNWALIRGALIWGMGCGFGLVVYMVYVGLTYRDFLYFSTVQTTLWHAHWQWPWVQFIKGYQVGGFVRHRLLRTAYDLAGAVYVLGAVLLCWRWRRTQFNWERTAAQLYAVAGLLISLSFFPGSAPFHSAIRIMSVYFPIYTGLAGRLPKWVYTLVLIGFIAIAYIGTSRFTHGYFFQ